MSSRRSRLIGPRFRLLPRERSNGGCVILSRSGIANGIYRKNSGRLDGRDEGEGRAAVERAADDEGGAEEQGNREDACADGPRIAAGVADAGEAAARVG